MSGAPGAVAALLVLGAALSFAVIRPRGASEALVAAPGAVLLMALGALPWRDGARACRELLPTVVFLCLILAFGFLCSVHGVFRYLAAVAVDRSRGDARRLLMLVVALASLVTAVLTLDATVVLLTPVIAASVMSLRVGAHPLDGRAPLYACVRLANAGSLLLPVSNLTNLLAFPAAQRSFAGFAAVMAAPWLVAVVLEWLAIRLAFAPQRERMSPTRADEPQRRPMVADRADEPAPPTGVAPRYALAVLVVTLGGFVVASAVDAPPAWAAGAGAAALAVGPLRRRQTSITRLGRELHLGFALFVLSLAVIVAALIGDGGADVLRAVLPHGEGLLALLAIAGIAAAVSNIVNNIPATLALAPLLAGRPEAVLAMLIGVNVGPNLTYAGSLATLLWRRRLPDPLRPSARQFHALGLCATPVVLVAATAALWCALRLIG